MKLPVLRVIAMTVVCIVLAAVIFIYQQIPEETNVGDQFKGEGGCIVLQCELPTERPTMIAPEVEDPLITDIDDARSYALETFPQFNDAEFEESYSGKYIGYIDGEMIQIFTTGTMIYAKHVDDTIIPASELSQGDAISGAVSFINSYEGIGEYSLYQCTPITVEDDDPETELIEGYYLEFNREYEGYPILGSDVIRIHYLAEEGVSYYFRGHYSIGDPVQQQQVISASEAWTAVTNETVKSDPVTDINITQVDLCYYVANHRIVIDILEPYWRFSGPDDEFFVYAFDDS